MPADLTATAGPPRTLAECERIIERGLATFVEVGEALLEIRSSRIYRDEAGFDTFENYCRERWGFSKAHANRQIEAAEVAVRMAPMGVTPPNERQARELAPLKDSPLELDAAWQEVTSSGPATADRIRQVVEERVSGRTRGQLANQADGRSDWATPQDLFDALNAEFDFDLDVCATDASAKCQRYFTPAEDGLAQEWTGTCFMNPPYGNEIRDWVRKAWESAEAGATVVCLVPARVGSGWWWDFCRHGEVRFLRGRLRFDDGNTGAPFDSAVVVFGTAADVHWWER